MESLDYWRLCDELSVNQAAQLVVGAIPGEGLGAGRLGVRAIADGPEVRPSDLEAARSAIGNAILGQRLRANIRYATHTWDAVSETMVDLPARTLDFDRSTVLVAKLKPWLWERGLRSGFFFPSASDSPAPYLNPKHPRYAPKLAAAVRAWLAVDDPNGKHPKKALQKWLREKSAELGLSDKDGRPNELGIEECAKVANWQPSGGAPKTPRM